MNWYKCDKPGDKIVCIDAKPRKWPGACVLEEGRVYTVKKVYRAFFRLSPTESDFAIGVLIEEVDAVNGGAFLPDRFRPVQISINKGMETLRTFLKTEKAKQQLEPA